MPPTVKSDTFTTPAFSASFGASSTACPVSKREQQSCWNRLKAPAAVSLACLAATLLIAAQGFRGHPVTRHSDLPSQQSKVKSLRQDITEAHPKQPLQQPEFSQSTQGDAEAARVSSDPISKPDESGGAKLKQKAFVHADIAAKIVSASENATEASHLYNISAYREELQGMEILIVNKTLNTGRAPSGILLIFHGCSHGALDWWYPSQSCQNCTGLPEEVAVTKAALGKDFVVVAFSSLDRDVHQCWDVSFTADTEASKDLAKVIGVWQELMERETWARVPHYALGGSSGGAFVMHLALRMPIDGIVPVIMGVQPELLETKPHAVDQSKSWPFPPTFFIHMVRDESTAEMVSADIAVLKKQGVPVNEIAVMPRNLSSTYFSDRISTINNITSLEMYQALLTEGCLNSTGYLIDNPRSMSMMRRWQKALRENVANFKTVNFNKDEAAIFEELNLAWAGHELVADHTDIVLDWLAAKRDGPKLMTAVNPRLQ